MKVTRQTLPLFNEMYELKFSEEEMIRAFDKHDEVINNLKNFGKPYKRSGVGSIDHVIDNGINQITHTMYISDEWNGRLEIHAGEVPEVDEDEEKGEELIPTTTSYFKFTCENLTSDYTHIKVRTLDPQQLHTFLENINHCRLLDVDALNKDEAKLVSQTDMFEDLTWLIEATSGHRVLEKIKNNEVNRDTSINSTRSLEQDIDEIKDSCEWLMPNAKFTGTKSSTVATEVDKLATSGGGLGFIEYIFEQDNYRLGILWCSVHEYYRNTHFRRLFLLSHEDELFNYADVDRVVLFGQMNYYRHSHNPMDIQGVLGRVLFTEEVTLPASEAIEWIVRHATGNETNLMDETQLKLSTKKYLEDVRRRKEEEEEKKALEKKLVQKIESIKKGKKLTLNGMTITKDAFEYEGQILKRDDDPDWVTDLLRDLSSAYQFDNINWDSAFDEFIQRISGHSSEGQIGDVTYKVNYDLNTNSAGVTSTRTYINEFRINKDEISDCLRRAVCYTNQDDFNEFLGNVSSCSLKFHRYLQTGVDFEVYGMRRHEGFSFKLPLERRKNLMYVVLGDNEYKVRDTNRLINMQKLRDLGEIMELLLGDKVLEGLTLDDAKTVLKLAKIEFQDAIDKSKKLLEETEKTLKLVKQENIQMNEITVRDGYIVNGKLRQYVVANSEKCEVYEYPSGRYICIVDKSTSQVGKDKLINRLYALANDQALAKDIHTLN